MSKRKTGLIVATVFGSALVLVVLVETLRTMQGLAVITFLSGLVLGLVALDSTRRAHPARRYLGWLVVGMNIVLMSMGLWLFLVAK